MEKPVIDKKMKPELGRVEAGGRQFRTALMYFPIDRVQFHRSRFLKWGIGEENKGEAQSAP